MSAVFLLQMLFPDKIDELLSSNGLDQIFAVKDTFLQQPGKCRAEDTKLLLHTELFFMGGQLVPVRISGDLIDGDRDGPIVKVFFLKVHGEEEMVIRAYLIIRVIRLLLQKRTPDEGRLMAEGHLISDMFQRKGRIKLLVALIDAQGISVNNRSAGRL